MIYRRLFALCGLFQAASAAPAVVWSNKKQSTSIHSSRELQASEILGTVLPPPAPTSRRVAGVVFLLGRTEDGSESFSKLASQGDLPLIASEYENAQVIHHCVQGMDKPITLLGTAARQGHSVMEVTLDEFASKLSMLDETESSVELEVEATGSVAAASASKSSGKRARALAQATVFVVKVNAVQSKPSDIDRAVVQAIHHPQVDSVILAGVRSVDEVKDQRNMFYHQREKLMHSVGERVLASRSRRRLDQQQAADDANNNNNANQDLTGIYYVHMTPNILAGLLFAFLFTTVTFIAVSCMGMISGQDTYVTKYPSIGREV